MGGWEALACAAPEADLGGEFGAQIRRTVLRRTRRRPRSAAEPCPPQRHQPPSDKFLSPGPKRSATARADAQRRDAVLSISRTLQPPDPKRQGTNRGRRAVVLLPQPHVLQWSLPL